MQSILPVKEEHRKLRLVSFDRSLSFLISFAKPFKYSSRKEIILLLINYIVFFLFFKRVRGLRTRGLTFDCFSKSFFLANKATTTIRFDRSRRRVSFTNKVHVNYKHR